MNHKDKPEERAMNEFVKMRERARESEGLEAERKRSEKVMGEANQILNKFMDSAVDGLALFDSELNLVEMNRTALSTNPRRPDKEGLLGKNILEIAPDLKRTGRYDRYLEVIKTGKPFFGEDLVIHHKFGDRQLAVKSFKVGEGLGIVTADITGLRKAAEAISRLAYYDHVTGLPNRMLFNDRLTLALSQAHRKKQKLAVMFLDLDYFKSINDALGHSAGDKLLRAVGDRLRSFMRGGDTVARFGGDEFLLILPEISGEKHAARLAQRILQAFREPFMLNNHKLHVSTSIGIATYPRDGKDTDTLVKNADIAMYEVKKCGRNSYQFCSSGEDGKELSEPELCEAESRQKEAPLPEELTGLRLLQQITGVVLGTFDSGNVFRQVTDGLVHCLGYTSALILTLDGGKKRFEVRALSLQRRLSSQIDKKLGFSLGNLSFPKDSRLNGAMRSAMRGRVVVTKTLAEIAYPLISRKACSTLQELGRTKNHIVVPLGLETKMVGAILVTSPREQVLEEELTMLQTLARVACQAIKNANLHSQAKHSEEALRRTLKTVRRTLEGAVRILSSIVAARDPYTGAHQQRVANLACAIGKEMGLSEEKIEGIRIVGLLHDVGKVVVPVEILSKPGPINPLELSVVKDHPRVGYDILMGLDFPWPVAEIVYQHHERLDGSGYPRGLSGSEILPEARISGLADVVEAVSHHRPYRPALGIDWALDGISRNKGTLYDPEVVDACLAVFAKNGFRSRWTQKGMAKPKKILFKGLQGVELLD